MNVPPDGKPPRSSGLISPTDALSDYLQSLLGGTDNGVVSTPGEIDCEAFSVRGLVLAVRREDFAGVLELPEMRPTPEGADGRPPWLSECQLPGGRWLRLVLTERLIAPAGHCMPAGQVRQAPRRAVLLSDGVTALAADELLGGRRIDPGRICWRTPHTRRPWLAGVGREAGVVLLEIAPLLATP
jgi:hypothetical protein